VLYTDYLDPVDISSYGDNTLVIFENSNPEEDLFKFEVTYQVYGDKDNDGVTDNLDDCYNPGCTKVNSNGCPKDSDGDSVDDCEDDCYNPGCTKVNSNGCPKDSDGDGVDDCEDDCYNPECITIDPHGCPKDSDGDGVIDCEDECVSEYGDKENDGCPSFAIYLYGLALGGLLAVVIIGVLLYLRKQKKEPPIDNRTYTRFDGIGDHDDTRIYSDDTRIYDDN
jgi:hypothetical protein